MDQSTENWKPVTYEPFGDAYEVSSHGRVRSLDRVFERSNRRMLRVKGQVLSVNPSSRGYPRVTLNRNGHSKDFNVHTLVSRAFLGEPPSEMGTRHGELVVNHIDADKTNNHFANLEYITTGENLAHADALGLRSLQGARHHKAKLSDLDVRAIRKMYAEGMTQVQLASIYGVYQTTISLIVRRKGWKHIA